MSIDLDWQCLSVAEFTDNCHWYGWSPEVVSEVAELSISVNALEQSLLAWQTLSTQDFFESNNWNGLSNLPSNIGAEIVVEESKMFSLALANHQFWSCFAWVGSTNQLEVTDDEPNEPIAEAAAEYTLSDLSQLF